MQILTGLEYFQIVEKPLNYFFEFSGAIGQFVS